MYRAIVRNLPRTSVSILDHDFRWVMCEGAALDVLGLEPERIEGRTVFEVHEQSPDVLATVMPRYQAGLEGYETSFEIERNGQWFEVHVSPIWGPGSNSVDYALVITYVITERKRTEAVLRARAETDSLTGLLNRASFSSVLAIAKEPYTVVYLDLDGFKPVNDAHGHGAGDEVLVVVAQRLRNAVRSCDAVARLGGDEFAIMLQTDNPDAFVLRLQELVAEPVQIPGNGKVAVTASVGFARCPDDAQTGPMLLTLADQRMLRAKRLLKPGPR